MNICAGKTAALAFLLSTALPSFASEAAADKPIAVQMYTLRNAGALDRQLKIVHDAGVQAVELAPSKDVSALELKQLLDTYSIKVVSSHVLMADLRSNLDGVVAFNQSIGNTTLVVPYPDEKNLPPTPRTGQPWDRNWAASPNSCATRACAWRTTTTTSSWSMSMAKPVWKGCLK